MISPNRRILLATLAASCFGLSGCSALIIGAMKNINSSDIQKMSEVPADRQFAYREAKDGYGTVIIGRQSVFMGSGCYFGIFVDGEFVGRLDGKEKIILHLPIGEHLLKVGGDIKGRGTCSASSNPAENKGMTQETIIHAGQTKVFQCYVDAGTETFYQFMRVMQ